MQLIEKLFPKKPFKESFSQCGEDIILDFIFLALQINKPTYLDIGANDPCYLNNTYFFYKNKQSRGVLVEPNPMLAPKLKKYRPNDILINCGIGFDQTPEADYYVMDWHEFNTFSKEIAEETQAHYKGQNNIKQVIKLKLVHINSILSQHFSNGLDLLSIDVEGLDLTILNTLDFNLCTPKIICVETKVAGNISTNETINFMRDKGYRLFSQTPINGIFIHEKSVDIGKI